MEAAIAYAFHIIKIHFMIEVIMARITVLILNLYLLHSLVLQMCQDPQTHVF